MKDKRVTDELCWLDMNKEFIVIVINLVFIQEPCKGLLFNIYNL